MAGHYTTQVKIEALNQHAYAKPCIEILIILSGGHNEPANPPWTKVHAYITPGEI